VNPERSESPLNADLKIEYTCRSDDPAPVRPVKTDNPGFGVSGTISASGTFLLSGAGWYPRVADARQSFMLTVEEPEDTVAVTAGRLLVVDHQGARTISRWQIDNHFEGMSLSAGPYVFEKRMQNGLTATTYFLPENQVLAPKAFDAGGQHFDGLGDVLFAVARHPDHSGRIVALRHTLSPEAADEAALKIPHYGRYRYLAFSNGQNRIKGTWAVDDSPVMVHWNLRASEKIN
jgi:hypothetical protein